MKDGTIMKRLFTGVAALAVVAGVVAPIAGPASASGRATTGTSSKTIVDVLLSDAAKDGPDGFDRRWNDFDIVTEAVKLFPDLVAAASDPTAQLTVMAPTDQAFRNLATSITKKRYTKEADVFAAIASLGLPTVKSVLLYHIVPAGLSPKDVLSSDLVPVTTLSGGTFTVDVINKRAAFVQFVDGDPNARNAFLVAPSVGGALANGYIHGINQVLRPIDLP
jgi:uncharacterized surface protein with fasciclin (FAS1) repeats